MGRAGAIAGPLVAGLLIGGGWSRAVYCITLAAPALIAAASVYWIGLFDAPQPEKQENGALFVRPAG
jgi:AAHS family 4-hydroxybenzoate transporter-like MFS transporter